MKNTDKNFRQNSFKKESSNDTLLYILLLVLFAVLVGSLAWHFWPTKNSKSDQKYNYEEVLGKKLTSPTAKEVSKLIQGNHSRKKAAERVLNGKTKRVLTAEEAADVRNELNNYNEKWAKDIQKNFDLCKIEKEEPEKLNLIYNLFYEQGKITVRLKEKTLVSIPNQKLRIKQKELQDKWYISEQEKADIDEKMKYWIEKWYNLAKKEIIDSGKQPLLTEHILPHWINGVKKEYGNDNPPFEDIRQFKIVHKIPKKNGDTKDVDTSQPLTIEFNGYYGFLSEKDKEGSPEGSETFGLTKYEPKGTIIQNGSVDEKGDPIKKPPEPNFNSFSYCKNNLFKIKIGIEKKLFFNRLGYEYWWSGVNANNFDISFENGVLETIIHELAHAIVSSIRVDYKGEEEGGHGNFFYQMMEEIEKVIRNSPDSEFKEFEAWWKKPASEQRELSAEVYLVEEKSHWEKWKYWYIGGGVLVLLVGGLIIVFWEDLTGRKKNVKN